MLAVPLLCVCCVYVREWRRGLCSVSYYKHHTVWTAWRSGLVLIARCTLQLISVEKPESRAVGRQRRDSAIPMQYSHECNVQCAVVARDNETTGATQISGRHCTCACEGNPYTMPL